MNARRRASPQPRGLPVVTVFVGQLSKGPDLCFDFTERCNWGGFHLTLHSTRARGAVSSGQVSVRFPLRGPVSTFTSVTEAALPERPHGGAGVTPVRSRGRHQKHLPWSLRETKSYSGRCPSHHGVLSSKGAPVTGPNHVGAQPPPHALRPPAQRERPRLSSPWGTPGPHPAGLHQHAQAGPGSRSGSSRAGSPQPGLPCLSIGQACLEAGGRLFCARQRHQALSPVCDACDCPRY